MNATGTRLRASRKQHSVSPTLAFFTFVTLAAVLPYVVATQPSAVGETSTLLCLVIVMYSAARLSLMVLYGNPRPLALGFQLFLYPFVALSGLAQITSGVYPLLGASYTESTVEGTLLLIIAGIIAYEVGYFTSSLRRPHPERSSVFTRMEFQQAATIVLGLFGLAFLAYTVAQVGLQPFFSSRDDAAQALAGTTGQVYALEDKTLYLARNLLRSTPIFVALVATLVLLREGKWKFGPLGKPATYGFLFLLVCANVVSNNPFSNSRFWFGTIILTVVSIYLPWRTLRGFRFLLITALGIFIFLFGLFDAFRRPEADFQLANLRTSLTSDESYSALQTTLNGYAYSQQNPPSMGAQALTAILTFVPRSVWAAKGVDTGSLVDSQYNRAATLWTEFSVDFGLTGVVFGFLLYGMVAAFVDLRVRYLNASVATLAALAIGLQILLLRGSLVTVMTQLYSLAFFFGILFLPWGRVLDTAGRRHRPQTFARTSQQEGE